MNKATVDGQRIQSYSRQAGLSHYLQPAGDQTDSLVPGNKATLEELQRLRADGFWLLYDVTSERYVELLSKGKVLKAKVSFGKEEDIDWVISHRWKDEDGLPVAEGDAPTGFMFGNLPKGKIWVDYLNHLGNA